MTTHWSVVLAAQQGVALDSSKALDQLCATYWRPLYFFVRRRGYAVHDAQDLTQEFFHRFLEKEFLRVVDPAKGKFRSFLLAALQNFLSKDWRREHAQKRGGNATVLSIDAETAEEQYLQVPSSNLSPEQVYDQQWALALLSGATAQLRQEFEADGKLELFEQIKIFLTGEKHADSYAMLAEKFQTTEAALKMVVSRMRKRYGELLRKAIADTVSSPDQVEEELRALFTALCL